MRPPSSARIGAIWSFRIDGPHKGLMGSARFAAHGPRPGHRLHADRFPRGARHHDRPVSGTRREIRRHMGERRRSGRTDARRTRDALRIPPARLGGRPESGPPPEGGSVRRHRVRRRSNDRLDGRDRDGSAIDLPREEVRRHDPRQSVSTARGHPHPATKTPRILKAGADFLAYTILDVLVDSYFPHLDRFQSLLDQLEEQIVARPSGTGIAHLHDVRTDLVRLRNDLRPQRDIFGVLSRLEVPLFRKEMRNYLRDVQDHMISVLDTLDAYREITGSLMEVQATLVSNQSNEVIKVLTVIFTITLPIAIVSSAFGMNVAFFGFNAAEGLYLALLLMGAPTGILAWWMHRKGWL